MRTNKKQRQKFAAIIVVSSCGIIGTLLLFSSHAATPTVSLEPESGVMADGATSLTDPSVSGGAYAQFGTSTTEPTCTTTATEPAITVTGYTLTRCDDFNSTS